MLWIAYIALLAVMIWTANDAPDPGIAPKMAEDLMRGAANMVRVLLPAGFVLALITVPIMLALRRMTRPTWTTPIPTPGSTDSDHTRENRV